MSSSSNWRSGRICSSTKAPPVPVELGGLGVSSAHDLVVAASRLARGDASVAIGVNMHLVAVLNMERRRQVALASGHDRRARGFAASLERIARDGLVFAAAISEPGQDLTRPGTRATRTESGWRIDGRKLFCTMSPAATDLYVAVRYEDDAGVERYAYGMVPADAPGVVLASRIDPPSGDRAERPCGGGGPGAQLRPRRRRSHLQANAFIVSRGAGVHPVSHAVLGGDVVVSAVERLRCAGSNLLGALSPPGVVISPMSTAWRGPR